MQACFDASRRRKLTRVMDNQNFFVIGKPGSGKSTYLKNEVLRDIEDGRAVVYVDPHGTDCLDLLDAIPRRRIRDVCYLDASDLTHAVGFQPLDAPHRLVSALRTIFKDSWGPRLEQFLRNGLAAIHEAGLRSSIWRRSTTTSSGAEKSC